MISPTREVEKLRPAGHTNVVWLLSGTEPVQNCFWTLRTNYKVPRTVLGSELSKYHPHSIT